MTYSQGDPNKSEMELAADFYRQWGRESLKSSIDLANDILKQIVTLSSVLIGASAIIIDKGLQSPPYLRVIIIVFFVVALIISFIGLIPYEHDANLAIDKIYTARNNAFKYKKTRILYSASCILVGLVFSIFLLLANESGQKDHLECPKSLESRP